MASIRSCLFALSSIAALATAEDEQLYKRDSVIGASVRSIVAGLGLGALNSLTTISTGAVDWISGAGPHNIFGNINNLGTILISQTDASLIPLGQAVTWTGTATDGNLRNYPGASIVLNDVSASTGATYNLLLTSLQNSGTIQFCGRGDNGGSNYALSCNSNTCSNDGLIVFEQSGGNQGASKFFRNAIQTVAGTPVQTINHNGGFLMRSARVDFTQNIVGSGCYMLSNNAVMFLQSGVALNQNPTRAQPLSGQTIYFTDATSSLHFEPNSYVPGSTPFGARILGFGAGNAIEFTQPIASTSYAILTGILTVNFALGGSANLLVGLGYNLLGFSTGTRNGFPAVLYNAAAPVNTIPAVCALTAPVCAPLAPVAVTPTSSTSTAPSTTAAANNGGGLGLPPLGLPSISLPVVGGLTSVIGGVTNVVGGVTSVIGGLTTILPTAITIPPLSLPPVSISVPDLSLSIGLSLPVVSVPTAVPSITLPDVSVPTALTLPTVSLPTDITLSLLTETLPAVSIPTALSVPSELPSVSIPVISLPTEVLPSLNIPTGVSLPGLPTTGIPSISLPSISLPLSITPTLPLTLTDPSEQLPSLSGISILPITIPTDLSVTLPITVPTDLSASLPTGLSLPPVSLPSGLSLPSVTLPTALSLPSISLPTGLSLPSVSLPTGLSLPSEGLPSVSLPTGLSLPSVSLPTGLSLPSISLPTGLTLPPVSLPTDLSLTVPSVTLPLSVTELPGGIISTIVPIVSSILGGNGLTQPALSVPTELSITIPGLSVPTEGLPSASIPNLSVPSVSVPDNSLPSLSVPEISLPSLSLTIPGVTVPSLSVPAATLPSVSIPSISVPGVSVPSVSVPTVSAPSLGLPSESLPGISVPSVSLPGVTIPSVSLPTISLPGVSVPSVSIPSVSLPGISVPSVSVPSVSLPGVTVPSVSLPTVSLPGISVPSVSLPSETLPGVGVPSVTLPSISIPSIGLPSITLPSVSVPAVSLPSVSLPGVSVPTLGLSSLPLGSVSVPSVLLPSATAPGNSGAPGGQPSNGAPSNTLVAVSSPALSVTAAVSNSLSYTLGVSVNTGVLTNLNSLTLPSLSLPGVSLPTIPISTPSASLSASVSASLSASISVSVSIPSLGLSSIPTSATLGSVSLPALTSLSLSLPSTALPTTLPQLCPSNLACAAGVSNSTTCLFNNRNPYYITCSLLIQGVQLSTVSAPDSNTCLATCAGNPLCQGVNYFSNGVCQLFSQIQTYALTSINGAYSARRLATDGVNSLPSLSSLPTTAVLVSSLPAVTGLSTASLVIPSTVSSLAISIPSLSLSVTGISLNTPSSVNSVSRVSLTTAPGVSLLPTTLPTAPLSVGQVIPFSALFATSTCAPAQTATPCPGCNGAALGRPGEDYSVHCQRAYVGQPANRITQKRGSGKFKRQVAGTYEDCIAQCDASDNCQAASYNTITTVCSLYSCIENGVYDPDSQGYYKQTDVGTVACPIDQASSAVSSLFGTSTTAAVLSSSLFGTTTASFALGSGISSGPTTLSGIVTVCGPDHIQIGGTVFVTTTYTTTVFPSASSSS